MTSRRPEEMKISQLLDVLWDPIGVYDGPPEDWAPFGEYAAYVDDVLNLLRQGRSAKFIAAFLGDVASAHMEVEPTGSERSVAERLVAWYQELHRDA